MPMKSMDGLPRGEYVYRALKKEIVSGALRPGSRLVPSLLATKYSVSRTPVWDSVRRLSGEGLLHADARGGVIVAPEMVVEDVFILRKALEALATGLAASRIASSELSRLRLVLEQMEQAATDGDRRGVMLANAAFHGLIRDAAGNGALRRVGAGLRAYILRYSTLPFATGERIQQVLAEHSAIVQAIETGDPEAAIAASDHHLSQAHDYLLRMQLRGDDLPATPAPL